MSTAVLFNPQVAMRPGDYRDLFDALPAVRAKLAEASAAVDTDLVTAFHSAEVEVVNQGPIIRPMSLAIAIALFETAFPGPKAASYMAGLSLGQITAAHACGSVGFADAVRIVHRMACVEEEVFQGRDYGSVFCYSVDLDGLSSHIAELAAAGHDVAPCAVTGDDQMVVSGTGEALRMIAARAGAAGGVGVRIPYGPPGHAPMLAEVEKRFAAECPELDRVGAPEVPLVCNMSAEPLPSAEAVRNALVTQYTRTVYWAKGMRFLSASGISRFAVIGPGHFVTKALGFLHLPAAVDVIPFQEATDFAAAGTGA